MSKKRFDNLDPERQARLFESAADEFSEHGFEGASLNRILKRSGMSKSSLYYYFEDKSDLFVSMTERSVSYVLRQIGGFDVQQLTAENFWDEIERHVRRALTLLNSNAWYVKLGRMVLRLRGQPKGLERTSRLYEAAERFTGSILARGQELGVVRTDLPPSLLISATMGLGEAIDTWMLLHWEEMTAEERLEQVTINLNLVRRLCEPETVPNGAETAESA